MSSTQEKLEDRLDKLYNLPDDVPKELLQGIGFLRQFVNEERHGENKGLLKSSEIWHFLKEPVQALIDSAKREAYKQGYIDAGIKALTEQSEESKLSACCGAEITETGFCTDCKDNC